MKRFPFCAFFLLLGVAIADNSIPKLAKVECRDEGIYYKVKAGHTGTVKLWVDLEVTGKDGGYHDFDAVLIDPEKVGTVTPFGSASKGVTVPT